MLAYITGTFIALFTVVNPFGAMPVFLTLTADSTQEHRNRQAQKACLYFVSILIVFFLGGSYILNFFGISLESLRIAGGIIIIKSGLDLLNAQYEKNKSIKKDVMEEASRKNDISFTPLAMPMLSGPGSISYLIGMAGAIEEQLQFVYVSVAIIITGISAYIILRMSPLFVKLLGKSGLVVLSKMIGFIVLALGIQFIVNGVSPLLEVVLKR
jgi:multiple antibiotic resistance protein